MLPTPEKFENGVAAMFSGSRFMRIMMPPLLGLCALFALVFAIAGFFSEGGIKWLAAIGGLTWFIALALATYASIRPGRTRKIQGVFAIHLAVWLGFLAQNLLTGDSREADSWLTAVPMVLFMLGAFAYGLACFKNPASIKEDAAPEA